MDNLVLLVIYPDSGTILVLLVSHVLLAKIMMLASRDAQSVKLDKLSASPPTLVLGLPQLPPQAPPLQILYQLLLPVQLQDQLQVQLLPPPLELVQLVYSGLVKLVLLVTYPNSGITPVVPVSHVPMDKIMMSASRPALHVNPSTSPPTHALAIHSFLALQPPPQQPLQVQMDQLQVQTLQLHTAHRPAQAQLIMAAQVANSGMEKHA